MLFPKYGMKFKQWLEFESGAASSAQGGFQPFPGANLNTQLPVRSNLSCKDGSSRVPLDPYDGMEKPEKLFGFGAKDKKAADKRTSRWINRNSRRVPVTTIPPDIIY